VNSTIRIGGEGLFQFKLRDADGDGVTGFCLVEFGAETDVAILCLRISLL
jgi:hypothetical protein